MKTKITLLLFLVLSVAVSHAQTEYKLRQLMDFLNTKMTREEWNKNPDQSNFKGSPYLEDDFTEGTVYTVQKDKYVDVPMRYNIYNDDVEFKNTSGKVLAIAKPDEIEKVEIGNHQLFYIPYVITKKVKQGYLELVEGGNASLFIKHSVIFKDAEAPGAYKEAEPAQFVTMADEFYIRIGEEAAEMITNKKDLIEIFADHKNEIETYIKKHKIKTNKVDSLSELVKYYNSL